MNSQIAFSYNDINNIEIAYSYAKKAFELFQGVKEGSKEAKKMRAYFIQYIECAEKPESSQSGHPFLISILQQISTYSKNEDPIDNKKRRISRDDYVKRMHNDKTKTDEITPLINYIWLALNICLDNSCLISLTYHVLCKFMLAEICSNRLLYEESDKVFRELKENILPNTKSDPFVSLLIINKYFVHHFHRILVLNTEDKRKTFLMANLDIKRNKKSIRFHHDILFTEDKVKAFHKLIISSTIEIKNAISNIPTSDFQNENMIQLFREWILADFIELYSSWHSTKKHVHQKQKNTFGLSRKNKILFEKNSQEIDFLLLQLIVDFYKAMGPYKNNDEKHQLLVYKKQKDNAERKFQQILDEYAVLLAQSPEDIWIELCKLDKIPIVKQRNLPKKPSKEPKKHETPTTTSSGSNLPDIPKKKQHFTAREKKEEALCAQFGKIYEDFTNPDCSLVQTKRAIKKIKATTKSENVTKKDPKPKPQKDQHRKPQIKQPKQSTIQLNNLLSSDVIQTVISPLQKAGIPVALVGGLLRDYEFSRTHGSPRKGAHCEIDVDLAISGSLEMALSILRNAGVKAETRGKKHPIIWISLENNQIIEISSLHIVSQESDSSNKNSLDAFRLALRQRANTVDFTVNAFFGIIPSDGKMIKIVDPFDVIAYKDLLNMELCFPPGVDLDQHIQDDPGKILRAIYFRVKHGYRLEKNTTSAIVRNIHFLKNMTAGKQLHMIRKLFFNGYGKETFDLCQELGALQYLFPDTGEYEKHDGVLLKLIHNVLAYFDKMRMAYPTEDKFFEKYNVWFWSLFFIPSVEKLIALYLNKEPDVQNPLGLDEMFNRISETINEQAQRVFLLPIRENLEKILYEYCLLRLGSMPLPAPIESTYLFECITTIKKRSYWQSTNIIKYTPDRTGIFEDSLIDTYKLYLQSKKSSAPDVSNYQKMYIDSILNLCGYNIQNWTLKTCFLALGCIVKILSNLESQVQSQILSSLHGNRCFLILRNHANYFIENPKPAEVGTDILNNMKEVNKSLRKMIFGKATTCSHRFFLPQGTASTIIPGNSQPTEKQHIPGNV